MVRNLVRAAAALAFLAAAPAAFAQDLPSVISPLKVEMDHNGVNIVDGKTVIDGPTLSAPGASNLSFDRVQNAAPYVKGNYSVGDPDTASSSHSLHIGRSGSESFQCTGTDCQSVTGTGSTFQMVNRMFREAGTGALWHFNLKNVDSRNTSDTTPNSQYYASWVTYPDGETISYSYNSVLYNGVTYYRPVTLSSNLGYAITISYQGDTFTTNEWGTVREAALYANGVATPIQKLTYGGGTITDLAGRQYVCGGCSNQLGSPLETSGGSFQLPYESSPTLQVAQHASGSNVVGSVTKDGVGWTYSYTNLRLNAHASGYLYDKLTVTGPNGFQAVYDLAVRQLVLGGTQFNVLTKTTDALGRATSYSFDAATRPTKAIFPELNEVSILYDGYGNVYSKTTKPKPGSGLSSIVETAYFDEAKCTANPIMCYRPDYVRDGLNRQTDFLYNARGQVIEQTDAADQNGVRKKTYVTYDESTGVSRKTVERMCGLGSTCGTNQEIRTEYLYWGNTLLPSRERRIDAYYSRTRDTTFTYDAAGRQLIKDGPLAGTDDALYSRYDTLGRKSWEIGARSPEGLRIATRFTYRNNDDKVQYSETGTLPDSASETLSVFSRSDFTYDAHRNAIREAVSASGATRKVTDTSYDDRGQLVCTAIRMNPAAFGETPGACGLTTQGTQGQDRITRNEYDSAGQLTKIQQAYGTSLQQDQARYEYWPNGTRKALIDANGNRAEMTWDGHDRQKRWIFPSNTPGYANQADYEEYGYDLGGNRTSFRKRDGSVLTYAYDNLNRVIRKIVPERAGLTAAQTRDVYYDYDAMGLQTKARFDGLDGYGVTFYYDMFGQSTTTLLNMDGNGRYTSYYHDDGGRLWRLTHPDGVHFYYNYDALGRTTSVLDGPSTSMDDYVIRYWYNAAGNRYSAVRGAGTGGFTSVYYRDPLERPTVIANDLPGAGDNPIELGYNPAGQIVTRVQSNDSYAWTGAYNVSRAYSVNGLNQYIAAGPASFVYDANGNLTSDSTTSYTYDVENRLVGASNGASLVYDPLGRLFQTSGGAAGATQFNYDGDKLIAEYNGATLLRRYVHGPDADEPVAVYEGAGLGLAGRRYMMPDERGSIVALVNADGSPSAYNSYDAWGIPGAANAGRFQYTGQAWIPELGMYYYKARIYSPTLGRFLQTDPVGYDDQVNLYAYVGNDPVNATDTSGETRVTCTQRDEASISCSAEADGSKDITLVYVAEHTTFKGEVYSSTPIERTFSGALGSQVAAFNQQLASLCSCNSAPQMMAGTGPQSATSQIGSPPSGSLGNAPGGRQNTIDRTNRGAQHRVRELNRTSAQVRSTLTRQGFTRVPNPNPRVEIYERGNIRYVFRPSNSSPSGTKIDMIVNNKTVAQYMPK